jgi:UDP-N-acetylglucosamine diphosphorylase/glucosamine-1-phosphate N-acetyltransferase
MIKRQLAVVILAAGKGTRMNNPDMAKVMYRINDRPMIDYVIDLAVGLEAILVIAVVGWQKDSVVSHISQRGSIVRWVEQRPQLGTGHAVMQAAPLLAGFQGDVLVLSGDVPLLSRATMDSLITMHTQRGVSATMLTADLPDPTGYGRILRGEQGNVIGIVEHKDATESQRKITEINAGIYVFKADVLLEGLKHITQENVQHEYYLTDVFAFFWREHLEVAAMKTGEPAEIQGINTPTQLEDARRLMTKLKES